MRVDQYRVYCLDEQAAFVTAGYLESLPVVCPHCGSANIDPDETTSVAHVQDTEVQVSAISPDVTMTEKQVGFHDLSGYNVLHKGHLFEAAAGDTTEHEGSFVSPMKLQGIHFRVDTTAVRGDYLEIEMVDANGTYYPPGTVLAKFGETVYVWPGREFERICPDAKDLPPLIAIRFRYVSTGTDPVWVWLEHIMRTVPA